MTDAIPMSDIKQQIASAYPDKPDTWASEGWFRIINNIDVIVPELNDDTTMEKHLAHELLAMEFGIYYCDNCSTYTHIADELESCLFHQICGELLCRVASCQRESCRHNESRGFQWNGVNFYQGDKVRYSVYPMVVDGTGVVDYIIDEQGQMNLGGGQYGVRSTGQTLLDMDEAGLSDYCHVWGLYDIKKEMIRTFNGNTEENWTSEFKELVDLSDGINEHYQDNDMSFVEHTGGGCWAVSVFKQGWPSGYRILMGRNNGTDPEFGFSVEDENCIGWGGQLENSEGDSKEVMLQNATELIDSLNIHYILVALFAKYTIYEF